ncbi:MAG: hypothetical protein J6D52_10895 [Clostridia bacterium]|nr:hypothetical protein [Clostridia bacterium]
MNNYDDIFTNPQNEGKNNSQEFSKDDWVTKKQIEREQTYNMMNEMTETVAGDADAFKKFLDIQSRFDRFSVGNVMLIAAQMPEATRLGDYEYWAEQGEYVKKGSEAINILEPGNEYTREDGTTAISMNVKKMFDISQTGAEIKTYKTTDTRKLLKALVKSSPVPVLIGDNLAQGINAEYNSDEKKIYVRQGMEGEEIFRALAQEIAHADRDMNTKINYVRSENEFCCYCTAYMICNRYGVDTNAFNFEKAPEMFEGKENKEIRSGFNNMRDSMNRISEEMRKDLRNQNKQRDNSAR